MKMTETPRTEKAAFHAIIPNRNNTMVKVVTATVSRQLERKLNAEREKVKTLRTALTAVLDNVHWGELAQSDELARALCEAENALEETLE